MGVRFAFFVMILGIDPGREKIGWALVDVAGGLFFSGISRSEDQAALYSVFAVPASLWEARLEPWLIERRCAPPLESRLHLVALGDGTASADGARQMASRGWDIVLVDEKGTTLAARALYWRLHSPRFWQYLLPKGLRVPPRVLDDLAAWAIALKYLEKA